jgi:hypothetical protein
MTDQDEFRQLERLVAGLSPQEAADALGYGRQQEIDLGELAVATQVARWQSVGGTEAVAAWLAQREQAVADGTCPSDPMWPHGYQFEGRVYRV